MDKHKEIKKFLADIEQFFSIDDTDTEPMYIKLDRVQENTLELCRAILSDEHEKFSVEICKEMIIDLSKIAYDTAIQDGIIKI